MELAKKIPNRSPISKSQRRFLQGLFMAILTVRGKVNFCNMSRCSSRSEKTYARQFAKPFFFVAFNRQRINAVFGLDSERVLAFDPTFIPKAGPQTARVRATESLRLPRQLDRFEPFQRGRPRRRSLPLCRVSQSCPLPAHASVRRVDQPRAR